MKIDYTSLPAHHAIVAHDAAIVAREKARPSIETRDAKFYTGTGDPLPPQVRFVKKASHPMIYKRRTSDTVITPPTPEEDSEWTRRMATMSGYDGGLQWQGDLQPVGHAVNQVLDALRRVKDHARAKDALSQAVCAIANFGNFLETSEADGGPAGALAFPGNLDEMRGGREEDISGHGVNAKPHFSKASVGDSGGAQMRRLRDQTGNEIASMQRQYDAYWEKQTAWQKR
jgi:hypothetical protein